MFGSDKGKRKDGALYKTRNWYSDRYQFVVVQRNILLLITVLALLVVGASIFYLAELTTSKTFEPFVIEVEDKTGITTQVSQDAMVEYAADESVKRYFLLKYIIAREGYDVNSYEYNYTQVVRLFSSGKVYHEFLAFISTSNPQSPVNFGRNSDRIVRLKSIAFLDPATKTQAQLRVVIEIKSEGRVVEQLNRIATINFTFNPKLQLSYDDRFINPLGFQVTGYRIDEDSAS